MKKYTIKPLVFIPEEWYENDYDGVWKCKLRPGDPVNLVEFKIINDKGKWYWQVSNAEGYSDDNGDRLRPIEDIQDGLDKCNEYWRGKLSMFLEEVEVPVKTDDVPRPLVCID